VHVCRSVTAACQPFVSAVRLHETMSLTPTVFISYSHDNEDHSDWVYRLACLLVENGIQTVLDQWDLQLGSNLISFMEKGLTNADRVLIVCTDKYNKKANGGFGGVGYEKNILTAELYVNQLSTKFVPIIRSVSEQNLTPICLGGRAYIDFSDDSTFNVKFDQLLRELHGVSAKVKPKLGKNPFLEAEEVQQLTNEGKAVQLFLANGLAKHFLDSAGLSGFPIQ
jgi:hypothetical protein